MATERWRLKSPDGGGWLMTRETRRDSYGRTFSVVFHDAALRLANEVTSGATLRVALWAIAELSPESWTLLEQKAIAEQLGTTQASVSRALKELIELGVLEARGSVARRHYRLNAEVAWRGSAGAWHRHQRQRAGPEGGAGAARAGPARETFLEAQPDQGPAARPDRDFP